MAEPFDSATTLQVVSETIQEQYYDEFLMSPFVTGGKTNRLLAMRSNAVTGDGETFQAKNAIGYSGRVGIDPYSEFDAGVPFDPQKVKVRWNEQSTSAHDFTNIKFSPRIGEYDLKRAGDAGAITSIVEQLAGDTFKDFDWHMALLNRVPRSCKVGDINGTKKLNDAKHMGSCTAYANGSTTMRAYVDAAAAPYFRKWVEYDIYNGSSKVVGKIRCTGMTPEDKANSSACSVGFAITSRSNTAANFDGVSDNYTIYLAGARNAGMYGIEAWMASPTATGDTFIGGVSRSDPNYQWMQPTATRVGSTAQKISVAHMNEAANARAFVSDDPDSGLVGCANPDVIDSLRSQIAEAAFINWPSDDSRAKRFGNLGMIGLNYQHPALGLIKLVGDEFMVPTVMDFYKMGSFMAMFYGSKRLNVLPGEVAGKWNRLPSGTAGNAKSLIYSMDCYADGAVFCDDAPCNVRINNITV